MRRTCVLLELYTGVELDACMQVAQGSVDNCSVGVAEGCVRLLGDELNVGGFGVVGQLMQGGQCKFHKGFI